MQNINFRLIEIAPGYFITRSLIHSILPRGKNSSVVKLIGVKEITSIKVPASPKDIIDRIIAFDNLLEKEYKDSIKDLADKYLNSAYGMAPNLKGFGGGYGGLGGIGTA